MKELKITAFVLVVAGLLASCHSKPVAGGCEKNGSTVPAVGSLAFDSVVVKHYVPLYGDRTVTPYYEVDVRLLYAKGDGPVARRINDTLMAARLFDVIEEHSPVMPTVQATVDTFAARYERAWRSDIRDAEFNPDSVPDFVCYTFSLRTWTEPAGEDRLAYLAFTEMYQGGAHGSHYLNVLNFDTRTGRLLTLDDVFKRGYKQPLMHLIMKQLAKDMELKDDSLPTLREAGFFWEMEPALPTVFQLKPGGIDFTYNIYDIAPYALGAISVDLTNAQLREWLK